MQCRPLVLEPRDVTGDRDSWGLHPYTEADRNGLYRISWSSQPMVLMALHSHKVGPHPEAGSGELIGYP